MIDINNLNFKYHKYKQIKVVNNISFNIKKGELVCLLGPSGCGKTSTLRLIAGLETPSSGSIYIEGKCVSDDNTFIEPHKRGIGFLFQDFALFPHLTAQENIAWGLTGIGHINKKFRIEELLKQTSLIEQKNKYPHELSGGEQQRVSLARALAPGPNLILLDEPFSSLDTNLRQDIRDETSRILKETNTTAIVVTHDPEEAMLIADKIILMNKGEIQQEGTAREIYHNPKNNFVASFLGFVNQFNGLVNGKTIETAVGEFSNKDFPDKAIVDIIVRPQDIEFSITNKNKIATIEAIKFVGAKTHIWFNIETKPNKPKKIMAIISENPKFKAGDKIYFKIKKKKVLIFKKASIP
jgi:iron(III) transport system ATP-binding protein